MYILGISAFYHDSAACLLCDGEIVAAAQEERFSRKKHDASFPTSAVAYCLAEARISPREIDFVAFYDKPLLKFERLIETYLAFAPIGFKSFLKSMPVWLKDKLHLQRELDKGLQKQYQGRYIFAEHHESHAASAFFPSPFREAAILTLDGVGEWTTASFGIGRDNELELTHELRFPHSLGLLYSAFTYYTGFKVNSGEYKLMGLAPYGTPRYRDLILDHLIDLREDGSFRINQAYFNYCQGLTMTGPAFDRLFDGPPRPPESELTQREMDIAASIQAVTDEVVSRAARHVARETGMRNLVMAGGVALNCVSNGRLAREQVFDRIWVQPAAGDAGGALGAAMLVWHQLVGKERSADGLHDQQQASLLGPRYSGHEIKTFLEDQGCRYHHFATEQELLDKVADEVAGEKVVGFFQGRMEFGPRALGSRSIIGDARSTSMQSLMNRKIKFRESFRPFAPSVLHEDACAWFDIRPQDESPYMLTVANVHKSRRLNIDEKHRTELGVERSLIPAVTHVDYSARLQTVDERFGRYYRLLKRFKEKTGCPVIINTSFNIRGEPIVCSPQDAYRCFMATNMDTLVLEDFVLFKAEQPHASRQSMQAYRAGIEPD